VSEKTRGTPRSPRGFHARIEGVTVLILEEDLLWSVRLRNGVTAAGHTPIVFDRPAEDLPEADMVLVNLGSRRFPPDEWIPRLRERGLYVIAHTGHKESELIELGKSLVVDQLVTNGMLARRLPDILAKVPLPPDED